MGSRLPTILPPLVRLPKTSCRLQLQPGFGFREAMAAVPYLASTGVTECYLSPIFLARRGSRHGYDVCDPNALNPALGTEADFDAFVATLKARDMGLILDIVPNHVAIDPDLNLWWRDVLMLGRASRYAAFFDITWEPIKAELKGKILLPILGTQYGLALDSGAIRLVFDDGELIVTYGDVRLPINPRDAAEVLASGVDDLRQTRADDPHVLEFTSIIAGLRHVPVDATDDPSLQEDVRVETAVSRDRLRRLANDTPWFTEYVTRVLRQYNGHAGDSRSFDRLHELLERQAYRLAYWRTSSDEINYRRFFDVEGLAALRMERQEVFDASHLLLQRLIQAGAVTGVRVDHPDGLYDPRGYFERLQQLAGSTTRAGVGAATYVERSAGPLFIVVEKVLTPHEALPPDWPVHGTTGYEFLNCVNGLFVAGRNAQAMRRTYARFVGHAVNYTETIYEAKKLILETSLASELNMLAAFLNRVSERDRHSRDFTLISLRRALSEFIACLKVYRTYVSELGCSDIDRLRIRSAIDEACTRTPELEPTVFEFLFEILTHVAGADAERLGFVLRLQQYTGAVFAKAIEDTAFFRHNVLISLNEVGGEPGMFGTTVEEFHQQNADRLARWPLSLTTTMTHDAKLGEDARARLNALSEMPEPWQETVTQWAHLNVGHRTRLPTGLAPDRDDEYRFYQVLVGIWPGGRGGSEALRASTASSLVERLTQYMLKTAKEAKRHTSWLHDNPAYDEATARFVAKSLTGPQSAAFLASVAALVDRIGPIGVVNSLAQTLLKIASPGVPDFYQGTDLWDHRLLDPDNRQPLDFTAREEALATVQPLLAAVASDDDAASTREALAELWEHWPDGRIKLFLIAAALRFRREHAYLMLSGSYLPLGSFPTVDPGVVAFARTLGDQAAIVIVPRLAASLVNPETPSADRDVWRGMYVHLPQDLGSRVYRNAFTGAAIRGVETPMGPALALPDVLASWPVALLVAQP